MLREYLHCHQQGQGWEGNLGVGEGGRLHCVATTLSLWLGFGIHSSGFPNVLHGVWLSQGGTVLHLICILPLGKAQKLHPLQVSSSLFQDKPVSSHSKLPAGTSSFKGGICRSFLQKCICLKKIIKSADTYK